MAMGVYVMRRLLFIIPVLIGASIIVFLISHVLPGDPAALLLGQHATQEQVEQLRHKWGLDRPLYVQYFLYLKDILHGDFGISLQTRRSVLSDLSKRFPASLELSTAGMLICLIIGIPLGVVSAVKKDTILDHITRLFSLIGVSMPVFWLGFMALLVFYLEFGWFSGGGRISFEVTSPTHITGLYMLDSLITRNWPALLSVVQHLALPALTLSFTLIAAISRITRSSMLEVLSQDYVQTARSKGLKETTVLYKHCLRNALLAIITVVGTLYGQLIGSLIVTETVFTWPGIGRYIVESILYLDYKPIMGFTILISLSFVVINLVVDILYAMADPRIKY
jgi:peptide/nickel transport system permease protein